MKIRKGKLIAISILIGLGCFNIQNVYAANAKVGVTQNAANTDDGLYDIGVEYNGGSRISGYCAQKGGHLQGIDKVKENNYNCSIDNSANGIKAAYILNSGYSDVAKTAALRFIISNQETSDASALQLINEANGVNSLMLAKTSENNNVVTYTINAAVVPKNIRFECGNNCESVTYDGNKTIKVTVKAPSCSYEFKIIGASVAGGSGGALRCSPADGEGQIVYAKSGSSGSSGSTSPNPGTGGSTSVQMVTGSLENTGSSYYKQYCSNNPNKCNQKTEVQIPTYCDSAKPESKTITITAPTDVQYCILNSNDDAGNTYQMNDEQLKKDTLGGGSNPYCSVWCKEDYKMEMPGAQYTTSGRYFELENTKVHGTKSCYATNADKNNDEPQINIEKYVEDIKKWQVEVVNRYNAYQLAKANVESAKAATLDDSIVSCSCKKNEGGVYKDTSVDYTNHAYTGPIVNYKKAVATLENAKTGKYRVTMTDASTSANYGYKWSCNGGDSCGATKNIYGKETLQEYIDIMNEALASLKEAQIKLQDTIQFMENCYSWVNEFCMNPEVVFDYNEQYISNKDFVLKSGSTEIIEENATYSSAKQIDKSYNADQGGNLEDIPYAFCEENTCMNGGKGTAQKISTLETHLYYRKIVAENTLEYNNDQEFASKYPHGTIEEAPEGSEGPFKNYEYLGAVFPVALKTPIGVYKWKLNFTNLGQYSNEPSCRNGRLDDVVAVVQSGKGLSADVQYVCVYVVDCPECKYKCVCPENLPDGVTCKEENLECIFDTKDCPECEVRCINCIFDGDDTIYYRTISLNYDTDDLNPNNRELGPNWNKDTNEKAKDTLKEMEKGEKAYEQAEYTFVITPAHMKAIRDYNRDTGTYVAEDLTYGEVDGVSNIAGYSKFLRGDSTQYSDSAYNRTFFKSAKLNSKWELWTSGIKDAVVPVNNNIGPAWK